MCATTPRPSRSRPRRRRRMSRCRSTFRRRSGSSRQRLRAFTVDAALAGRWTEWLAALEQAPRADAELAALSQGADSRFRVIVGERVAVFSISDRSIEIKGDNADTPFSLDAPVEVWQKFFAAVPPAFYHGVYAMKMRVPEFKVTGDELALAQSIHLVRRLLEIGRQVIHGVPRTKRSKRHRRDKVKGGYVRIELEGRLNRIYYET